MATHGARERRCSFPKMLGSIPSWAIASGLGCASFSTDSDFWRAQSRHISTARPDQTGKYRIRGLPAGEYYVTTVDPAEQGEWFEAAYLEERRIGAARVTVNEGDTKTNDFKVRLP